MKNNIVYRFVFAVLLSWTGSWALGQDSVARLQLAQNALLTQNYHQAKILAQNIENDYPVHAALIYARASLDLGDVDTAMRAADLAQKRAPSVAQVRVLRAMIYLRKNQPRRAMFALRRALDLAGSDKERMGIQNLLRNIQSKLRFQLTGGIGIAPSTNINNVARDRKYVSGTLPGFSGIFNPDDEIKSGVGLRSWLGPRYVVRRDRGENFSISANVMRNDYRDKIFSNQSHSLTFKWNSAVFQSGSQVGLSYGLHKYRGYNSKNRSNILSGFFTLPIDGKPAPNSQNFFRFTASHQLGKYPTGFSNFSMNRFGVEYFWPGSRTTAWRGSLHFGNRNSGSRSIANQEANFAIGVRKLFPRSGFAVDVSNSLRIARWDLPEFGFGSQRRFERDLKTTLRIERPKTSFYGFTPYGEISYTDRQSNQNIREYDSFDMFFGVKSAF